MRLTVVGCAPAEPQDDSPASGALVESGATTLLVDCGPGVVDRLRHWMDPRRLDAVLISHLHADHFLGLVGLRYLFPWSISADQRTHRPGPTVYLPPGGIGHLASVAGAICERPSFFDEAFDLREYCPTDTLRLGELEVRLAPARHYVPAVSADLRDRSGARLVITGDTGPTADLTSMARGTDLLLCEATLAGAEEDGPGRGHLTVDEAIELAEDAGAARTVLTHFASRRRGVLEAKAARAAADPGIQVAVARSGSRFTTRDAASERSVGMSLSAHG